MVLFELVWRQAPRWLCGRTSNSCRYLPGLWRKSVPSIYILRRMKVSLCATAITAW